MFRSRLFPTATALLVAVVSCRGEDVNGPATLPQPAAQVAATPLAFTQVSAGGSHTCGVTADNRGYCWGDNDYYGHGQLGDGTMTDRLTPTPVAGTLRFRSISSGGSHTCALTVDFRAYCWGSNTTGAVGDGTIGARTRPVAVHGGLKFLQIDAGGATTCGVSYSNRRAYCWGENSYGQIGDGTTTNRSTPALVAGGHQFRQLSVGLYYTCGVTTANEAFCWGSNAVGQIGDNSTATVRLTPSRVAGMHSFKQVDAGFTHSCAVTTDNQAYCWGNGRNGQVGDGKTYLRFAPRAVAGGLRFGRVTAGTRHTCGETTTNRLYCWGSNESGALGNGSTTGRRLIPGAVAGNLSVAQASAGDAYTCAKTPTGQGYCWGWNGSGQLGDGTTTSRSTPVSVAGAM